MILKDKIIQQTNSIKTQAGQKQESDVAFYLRRSFKNHKQVFIFNDVKFQHDGETAQIDHLIVHPYGFILIESKSITGEVSINKQGEWSRSYRNNWFGMPSPIKQAELQMALLKSLLKSLLKENAPKILSKMLGLQTKFGGREWSSLCAISSNAIIDREFAPKNILNQLVKSEFIADKLLELMRLPANPLDLRLKLGRAAFSKEDLENICQFIMEQDVSDEKADKKKIETVNYKLPDEQVDNQIKESSAIQPNTLKNIALTCKKCHTNNHLDPKNGRYGYFVHCSLCEINTPMKSPCPTCKNRHTKVKKNKESYICFCDDCQQSYLLSFK